VKAVFVVKLVNETVIVQSLVIHATHLCPCGICN